MHHFLKLAVLGFVYSASAFDLEDYATTYRATRDAYLKAANELKLATGPYKAARDAYVAATATYTKSLYERRRLMDTDNLSLDDLEKLSENPDSLFNGRKLESLGERAYMQHKNAGKVMLNQLSSLVGPDGCIAGVNTELTDWLRPGTCHCAFGGQAPRRLAAHQISKKMNVGRRHLWDNGVGFGDGADGSKYVADYSQDSFGDARAPAYKWGQTAAVQETHKGYGLDARKQACWCPRVKVPDSARIDVNEAAGGLEAKPQFKLPKSNPAPKLDDTRPFRGSDQAPEPDVRLMQLDSDYGNFGAGEPWLNNKSPPRKFIDEDDNDDVNSFSCAHVDSRRLQEMLRDPDQYEVVIHEYELGSQ